MTLGSGYSPAITGSPARAAAGSSPPPRTNATAAPARTSRTMTAGSSRGIPQTLAQRRSRHHGGAGIHHRKDRHGPPHTGTRGARGLRDGARVHGDVGVL